MHLGGKSAWPNVYSERFRGYRYALDEAGLKFENDLLVIGELNSQSGVDVAHSILK
jgi:DNA-binding LacI/PurR family transcriptional regulator